MYSFYNNSNFICDSNYSLSLDDNGNVWLFGRDFCSKFIKHSNSDECLLDDSYYIKIKSLHNIKSICSGDNFIICCDYSGNVFSFGKNDRGKLGIGKSGDEIQEIFIPQKLELPPINKISCGLHYTACITFDNDYWFFGLMKLHKPISIISESNIPIKHSTLSNIEFVECGDDFVFCKTLSGDIYSWGKGTNGALGHGDFNNKEEPTICDNFPSDIISIKCGMDHCLLLTNIGSVYSIGNNISGNLGLGDIEKVNVPTLIKDLPEIQRISCGFEHSMCLDISNNLWVFGWNNNGQLGLGDYDDRKIPTKHDIEDIIDISQGGDIIVLKVCNNSNTKIYGFGWNSSGALPIKSEFITSPLQILEGNEDIWCTNIGKSRAKSARK